MSSDDSSSEDEKCDFVHWNDWQPPSYEVLSCKNTVKKVCFHNSNNLESVSSISDNPKFGNWIPPLHFIDEQESSVLKRKAFRRPLGQNQVELKMCSEKFCENDTEFERIKDVVYSKNIKWENVVNTDWGIRVELHNVVNFNEGDLIWGVVKLSIFFQIKLWADESGKIYGLAEGIVSKEGSSEKTVISITSVELLGRMLNISVAQWASVCEFVQQNKLNLKFEALKNYNISSMSSFEKLWFLICKRRHFLPDQCMLCKMNGAIKSLKDFKIIPKLVVLDIRNVEDGLL